MLLDSSEPPTYPAIKKKDEPAWLTEVRRKFERDTNFVQNIPSISQLRDYPNTSVPLPIGSKLAGKKFARSTPSSPKAKEEFNFGQDIGACSTPVGSWDNFLEPPTYQGNNKEFWTTRQIEIVSSESLDTPSFSLEKEDASSLNIGFVETVKAIDSSTMSSPSKKMSDEKQEILNLEISVRDMISDLDPDMITELSAPSMGKELDGRYWSS